MKGVAIRLGDDVDTDQIIAGRYLRTKDKAVWAEHAFEDLDPGLASRLKGSVIVAGKNMGCGSSREQAAIALKEAGVVAVVAESFARIFFRNAVNRGIPMFEIPNGFICGDGDDISISLEESSVEINGRRYQALKLSDKMKEIIDAGGIIELRRREK
jgi:methanogen homoaconitase small subunit